MESLYEEMCEKDGYDGGFVSWLKSEVLNVIQLDYVLSLDADVYAEMLKKADEIKGKTQKLLIEKWMDYNVNFGDKSLSEIGAMIEMNETNSRNLSSAIESIQEQTGINIRIPRLYHGQLLFNRFSYNMSPEERDNYVMKYKGNQRVSVETIIERDIQRLAKIKTALKTKGNVSLRRFNPRKISVENLWVLQKIQEFERRKSTFE